MPGLLQWVSREARCQPGWPQGGLGEESWGCPAEHGLIGVSYTCSSGVSETVSSQVFACSVLGAGLGEVPLSSITTPYHGFGPIPLTR